MYEGKMQEEKVNSDKLVISLCVLYFVGYLLYLLIKNAIESFS